MIFSIEKSRSTLWRRCAHLQTLRPASGQNIVDVAQKNSGLNISPIWKSVILGGPTGGVGDMEIVELRCLWIINRFGQKKQSDRNAPSIIFTITKNCTAWLYGSWYPKILSSVVVILSAHQIDHDSWRHYWPLPVLRSHCHVVEFLFSVHPFNQKNIRTSAAFGTSLSSSVFTVMWTKWHWAPYKEACSLDKRTLTMHLPKDGTDHHDATWKFSFT